RGFVSVGIAHDPAFSWAPFAVEQPYPKEDFVQLANLHRLLFSAEILRNITVEELLLRQFRSSVMGRVWIIVVWNGKNERI
ncbi:unnamed protein product, partial [Didymodactylos carnosus]